MLKKALWSGRNPHRHQDDIQTPSRYWSNQENGFFLNFITKNTTSVEDEYTPYRAVENKSV